MKFPSLTTLFAILAASASLSSSAVAAPVIDFTGGEYIMQLAQLNFDLVSGKNDEGIKLTGLGAPWKRTIRFPVKGGSMDLSTGVGQIILGGGLVWTRTTPESVRKLVLTDMILDITAVRTTVGVPPNQTIEVTYTANVTALRTVDGKVQGRTTVFTLPFLAGNIDERAPRIGVSYKKANFDGGAMTLNPALADQFDSDLGLTDFAADEGTLATLYIRTTFKAQ